MATLACHEHPLLSRFGGPCSLPSGCGRGPPISALAGLGADGCEGVHAKCDDGHPARLDAEGGVSAQAIVAGVAASLERLINLSGSQRVGSSQFHAMEQPAISIFDYVVRLRKHFRCSLECFVVALVYMDRASKRNPEIEVGGLTCHRLLAASLTLAAKFLDDEFYSNRYYSDICGVPLRELNDLERAMLEMLCGELLVKPEEFDLYTRILGREGDRYLS
mmetsp:Transcript_56679/g.159019  ORF Transcript_56679/g.159019 Transcript_56679/m.159019 type:complete len:220 (-) Transcript_56679:24-683(-)